MPSLTSRFLHKESGGGERDVMIDIGTRVTNEICSPIHFFFSSIKRSFVYLFEIKKQNRFLSVKKWLLRKKHQVELARKRGWRGYWVCLKGTTLLFYPCDSREGRHVEAAPKHLIIVDGAIMQPIPEHPQRDFIFCLSTAFGDAYLFQVPIFL